LASSVRYLGEETDWETKLIGWTGEVNPKICRPWERKKRSPGVATAPNGVANGQLDDLDDPMPKKSTQDENSSNLVSLFKADKQQYEQMVNAMERGKGKKTELIPIWTLDDADGQPKGEVAESTETQGRFRKYAEQGLFPR